MKSLFISTIYIFLLVSCIPVETTNPEKAYTYWAGTEPPKEIEIIHAQYYQSPHFTLEYEFFLKFKPTLKWITEFIKQSGLELDKQNSDSACGRCCHRTVSIAKQVFIF